MLTVDEFRISRPEAFDIALTLPQSLPPDVGSGRVSVGDASGHWAAATIVEDSVGAARLDRGAIVLTWAEEATGFRLTGHGVDLDVLRMIAESMAQP